MVKKTRVQKRRVQRRRKTQRRRQRGAGIRNYLPKCLGGTCDVREESAPAPAFTPGSLASAATGRYRKTSSNIAKENIIRLLNEYKRAKHEEEDAKARAEKAESEVAHWTRASKTAQIPGTGMNRGVSVAVAYNSLITPKQEEARIAREEESIARTRKTDAVVELYQTIHKTIPTITTQKAAIEYAEDLERRYS